MGKKISVVMPTYNSEKYIRDAIDSLMFQSYQNFEVLVADAGSSDRTLEIIGNCNLNVKIVSKTDQGVADALNKGFNKASGEILCWLNSDDVLLYPDVLEKVQSGFLNEDANFAFGHCAVLDHAGIIQGRLFAFKPIKGHEQYGSNIFTGSLFFSQSAWVNFGGFTIKYRVAFEYELVNFLLEHYKEAFIPYFLGGFRLNPDGLSNSYQKCMSEEKAEIYESWSAANRIERLCGRIFAQVKQKTLMPAIANKLKRPERCHWRENYEKNALQMANRVLRCNGCADLS